MFSGLSNYLLSRLLSPDQYNCRNAGNNGRAYDLDVAEACQQNHIIVILSREHVTHQIACGTGSDRDIEFVLSHNNFGT